MAVPLTSYSSQYPLSQGPRPFERPRQQVFDKEAILATLQQYKKAPINADSYLDPKTRQRRDRIWQSWLSFAQNLDIDPHNIWIDLCTGAEYAQPIFQTYLKTYVESSVTLRPCLGPKEYQLVRTINSGATVEDIWTHLV
ncbi:hypothetical protein ACQKWADRAFT_288687, partial [Trichoderma austrokoningii]